MTPQEAFAELLGRIGANKGEAVLVSEEELGAWPDGAVRALKDAGLLSLASPASSVVCPGCEQECSMPVTTVLSGLHWSNATAIRTIFRQAFQGAGVPYFNPHSLRKTLARFGEQRCKTPEEVQGLEPEPRA